MMLFILVILFCSALPVSNQSDSLSALEGRLGPSISRARFSILVEDTRLINNSTILYPMLVCNDAPICDSIVLDIIHLNPASIKRLKYIPQNRANRVLMNVLDVNQAPKDGFLLLDLKDDNEPLIILSCGKTVDSFLKYYMVDKDLCNRVKKVSIISVRNLKKWEKNNKSAIVLVKSNSNYRVYLDSPPGNDHFEAIILYYCPHPIASHIYKIFGYGFTIYEQQRPSNKRGRRNY